MLVLFVFLVFLLGGKCVLSSGSGEEEQHYHKNNYPANINVSLCFNTYIQLILFLCLISSKAI